VREIFADVRVFDGERVLDGSHDVVADGGAIASVEPAGTAARQDARIVTGHGAMLLPGLIDAHVHLRGTADLEELARWGVTTALDMGSWPPELIKQLRGKGLTDVRSTEPAPSGQAARRRRSPAAPPTASSWTPRAGAGSSPPG
jgi:imidazolonepropionase-like amidohydrolase